MTFAIATRDELWIRGRRVESRLQHGVNDGAYATDARDDELVRLCEEALPRLREAVIDDARVRIVATAQREDGGVAERSSTMTVGMGALSIVTSPLYMKDDVTLLRAAAARVARKPAPPRCTTYLWRNGSAAVLLHEAAGHAAEHRHAPLAWPEWLSVEDEGADLLAGEPPRRLRRETFRDVPLRRMTNLVARQEGAPFAMPDDCIEIELLAGGAYDPLTEVVTLYVAAATHGGEALEPFTLAASRAEIARSLCGATGEPLRYPGVICSTEGQELFVGSHAPLLLTDFAR